MQVAGEGGMGEEDVVEVGVMLEGWKSSSSRSECSGGEVAAKDWARETRDGGGETEGEVGTSSRSRSS